MNALIRRFYLTHDQKFDDAVCAPRLGRRSRV
jgi:hypothetical protein